MSKASTSGEFKSCFANECGHTDVPHEGLGLCKRCYRRAYTLRLNPNAAEYRPRIGNATCHKDRLMFHSDGLCRKCYVKRRLYGVDFLAMYNEQDGNCKLCLNHFDEDDLFVDHDHTTLKVRGLVCNSCNLAIGYAEHPMLNLALAYLKVNR